VFEALSSNSSTGSREWNRMERQVVYWERISYMNSLGNIGRSCLKKKKKLKKKRIYIYMAKKHTKRYSTSLAIREMQIKLQC
jgi:hypothetical protein